MVPPPRSLIRFVLVLAVSLHTLPGPTHPFDTASLAHHSNVAADQALAAPLISAFHLARAHLPAQRMRDAARWLRQAPQNHPVAVAIAGALAVMAVERMIQNLAGQPGMSPAMVTPLINLRLVRRQQWAARPQRPVAPSHRTIIAMIRQLQKNGWDAAVGFALREAMANRAVLKDGWNPHPDYEAAWKLLLDHDRLATLQRLRVLQEDLYHKYPSDDHRWVPSALVMGPLLELRQSEERPWILELPGALPTLALSALVASLFPASSVFGLASCAVFAAGLIGVGYALREDPDTRHALHLAEDLLAGHRPSWIKRLLRSLRPVPKPSALWSAWNAIQTSDRARIAKGLYEASMEADLSPKRFDELCTAALRIPWGASFLVEFIESLIAEQHHDPSDFLADAIRAAKTAGPRDILLRSSERNETHETAIRLSSARDRFRRNIILSAVIAATGFAFQSALGAVVAWFVSWWLVAENRGLWSEISRLKGMSNGILVRPAAATKPIAPATLLRPAAEMAPPQVSQEPHAAAPVWISLDNNPMLLHDWDEIEEFAQGFWSSVARLWTAPVSAAQRAWAAATKRRRTTPLSEPQETNRAAAAQPLESLRTPQQLYEPTWTTPRTPTQQPVILGHPQSSHEQWVCA